MVVTAREDVGKIPQVLEAATLITPDILPDIVLIVLLEDTPVQPPGKDHVYVALVIGATL